VLTPRRFFVIAGRHELPFWTFAHLTCFLVKLFVVNRASALRLNRRPFGTQIALHMAGSNEDRRPAVAMLRLDYLSCFLTVVATILVGRKMWTGLVVSGVNSLIVCVIGLHTSQYGFIPANVFCICINAFNLRAWLKMQKDPSGLTTDASSELIAGCKRMSFQPSNLFPHRRFGGWGTRRAFSSNDRSLRKL
jgi:hypothetical protein